MFSVELPCSQSSVVSLCLYLCSENHPHHGFTEVRATAFQTLYRMTKLKSEMNFTQTLFPSPHVAVYNLTVPHALWASLLTVPSLESSEKVSMSLKTTVPPSGLKPSTKTPSAQQLQHHKTPVTFTACFLMKKVVRKKSHCLDWMETKNKLLLLKCHLMEIYALKNFINFILCFFFISLLYFKINPYL